MPVGRGTLFTSLSGAGAQKVHVDQSDTCDENVCEMESV